MSISLSDDYEKSMEKQQYQGKGGFGIESPLPSFDGFL